MGSSFAIFPILGLTGLISNYSWLTVVKERIVNILRIICGFIAMSRSRIHKAQTVLGIVESLMSLSTQKIHDKSDGFQYLLSLFAVSSQLPRISNLGSTKQNAVVFLYVKKIILFNLRKEYKTTYWKLVYLPETYSIGESISELHEASNIVTYLQLHFLRRSAGFGSLSGWKFLSWMDRTHPNQSYFSQKLF